MNWAQFGVNKQPMQFCCAWKFTGAYLNQIAFEFISVPILTAEQIKIKLPN